MKAKTVAIDKLMGADFIVVVLFMMPMEQARRYTSHDVCPGTF